MDEAVRLISELDAVVIDIAFQPDLEKLLKKLHVKEDGAYTNRLKRLVDEAQTIARPRALYKVGYIDSKSESSVVVDGIRFNSRVLRVNLENAHRVFPFVATCGTELHEWMDAQDDILQRYYAETISEMALRLALAVLREHLIERYRLGRTATMSPGSLPDWPIQAQQPLFALLGDTEETIGVRLTDSLWMIPSKSVSGMRFPIEQTFESCQLCPREHCPSRKAQYDKDLYDKRYRPETGRASNEATPKTDSIEHAPRCCASGQASEALHNLTKKSHEPQEQRDPLRVVSGLSLVTSVASREEINV